MELEPAALPREIEPLTQKSKNGELYYRDPKVEYQIKWALTLSQEELIAIANQAQPGDDNYLKEETLVYLIRAYHKARQQEIIEVLWKVLYQRCVKMIRSKIPRYDERSDQAEQEVQTRLFLQIIHPEGQQGDFLQTRFLLGLKALVITVARPFFKDLKRDKITDPLSSLNGQELEEAEDALEQREPGMTSTTFGNPGEISTEKQILISEAIKQLPESIKKAFILYYFMGYLIESDDPEKETISTLLSKSPKTIHNWLNAAESILKEWRGGEYEKSI